MERRSIFIARMSFLDRLTHMGTFPSAKPFMMLSIHCTTNQQKNMCKFPHESTDSKNTIVSTVAEQEKKNETEEQKSLF
jgi:hypothetical protein